MSRTTVVVSPHPDDEILYTGAYVTTAAARGDNLILLAVSDGDGSGGAALAGWTVREMVDNRVLEQTAAWRYLTMGARSDVRRMGYPDASDDATLALVRSGVKAVVQGLSRAYSGGDWDLTQTVEFYCAGGYDDTQSPYHQAVANGIKDAAPAVARFTSPPGSTKGSLYTPTGSALSACKHAVDVYRAFGSTYSVGGMFADLKASGYVSRVYP